MEAVASSGHGSRWASPGLRIRVTRSERLARDDFTFIRLASRPVDGLASELDWSPILGVKIDVKLGQKG